jgi:hypothetical protein
MENLYNTTGKNGIQIENYSIKLENHWIQMENIEYKWKRSNIATFDMPYRCCTSLQRVNCSAIILKNDSLMTLEKFNLAI